MYITIIPVHGGRIWNSCAKKSIKGSCPKELTAVSGWVINCDIGIKIKSIDLYGYFATLRMEVRVRKTGKQNSAIKFLRSQNIYHHESKTFLFDVNAADQEGFFL